MKIILTKISGALRTVLNAFFSSDLDVMSDEVRQILSNPVDAEKYKKAVREIEEGKQREVTITLSNQKQLTLIQ